ICDNCTMVNGVGYKAHWGKCDLFIQCMFGADGSVTVRIKQCPHGLHWDQASLTCNRPDQARCPHDRCRQPGFRVYPATNNCRGYWQCVNGVSDGKCCPQGYAFSMGGGCVPSATCNTPCGVSPPSQGQFAPNPTTRCTTDICALYRLMHTSNTLERYDEKKNNSVPVQCYFRCEAIDQS
ncbi:hypothetical protein BaRGS_00017306, partial [Batillaria attramentaria]